MVEYTFEVSDMNCRGCENMLREGVTSLQGIATVETDSPTSTLVARGESGMEDRVRQAISETGYSVRE